MSNNKRRILISGVRDFPPGCGADANSNKSLNNHRYNLRSCSKSLNNHPYNLRSCSSKKRKRASDDIRQFPSGCLPADDKKRPSKKIKGTTSCKEKKQPSKKINDTTGSKKKKVSHEISCLDSGIRDFPPGCGSNAKKVATDDDGGSDNNTNELIGEDGGVSKGFMSWEDMLEQFALELDYWRCDYDYDVDYSGATLNS